MLKKEVCKKCRAVGYQDILKAEDTWNELCEAWFALPVDQVWCPPIIIRNILDIADEKIKEALSEDEYAFLRYGGYVSTKYYQSISAKPSNPPPWYCPYKEEHEC